MRFINQASLSENDELVSLTKEISNELNIGAVLINAIAAYINHLKSNGASHNIVHEHKYFLTKLAHYVYGITIDGVSYRKAVNELLLNVPDENQAFCIKLARSFYGYWRTAHNAATVQQTTKLSFKEDELVKLWHGIDEEFLYALEDWLLNLYSESMRQMGIPQNYIDIRQKIVKVIMVELRKVDTYSEEDYRNTINRVQPLFSSLDMQDFFLTVSREFYRFWAEHQSTLSDDTKLI